MIHHLLLFSPPVVRVFPPSMLRASSPQWPTFHAQLLPQPWLPQLLLPLRRVALSPPYSQWCGYHLRSTQQWLNCAPGLRERVILASELQWWLHLGLHFLPHVWPCSPQQSELELTFRPRQFCVHELRIGRPQLPPLAPRLGLTPETAI